MDMRYHGKTIHTNATEALRDCLERNYDYFQRRLTHFTGCAELASDCLHDAWLKLGEMELPDEFFYPKAYVYRVACNLAIDAMRTSHTSDYEGDDVLELAEDSAPGPESVAAARAVLADVQAAMDDLPNRYQAILVSLRLEGDTREEVASRYGMSLRNVDTMLRQALDYCHRHSGYAVTSLRQTVNKPLIRAQLLQRKSQRAGTA